MWFGDILDCIDYIFLDTTYAGKIIDSEFNNFCLKFLPDLNVDERRVSKRPKF
jgi:hypothetical protein